MTGNRGRFYSQAVPAEIAPGVSKTMDAADTKNIDVLTETIARQKADLKARMKHLRKNQNTDSEGQPERRPGRLYEVFQAIND